MCFRNGCRWARPGGGWLWGFTAEAEEGGGRGGGIEVLQRPVGSPPEGQLFSLQQTWGEQLPAWRCEMIIIPQQGTNLRHWDGFPWCSWWMGWCRGTCRCVTAGRFSPRWRSFPSYTHQGSWWQTRCLWSSAWSLPQFYRFCRASRRWGPPGDPQAGRSCRAARCRLRWSLWPPVARYL